MVAAVSSKLHHTHIRKRTEPPAENLGQSDAVVVVVVASLKFSSHKRFQACHYTIRAPLIPDVPPAPCTCVYATHPHTQYTRGTPRL